MDAPCYRTIGREFNTYTICLENRISNEQIEPYSNQGLGCHTSLNSPLENEFSAIEIWPNPFVNSIQIEFENPFSGMATITDLSGKKLASHLIEDQINYAIDSRDFCEGIYFLTIENKETSQTYRLIKN